MKTTNNPYPCREGVCPFAIEPTGNMCKQCEDDHARDLETNYMEDEIMTTNQLNQATVDQTIKTMEVSTMTNLTKQQLRTMIEQLHPEFVISNTAFKVIKREQLVELYECLPEVIRLTKSDISQAFAFYIEMAKRGTVFPMVDVKFVPFGASEASVQGTGLDTVPVVDASAASITETEAVLATESVSLPRAGIKDGVLGLYVDRHLVTGIADLSYAQKQIDAMLLQISSLQAKVNELEGKQPGVVEQAPVAIKSAPVRTCHQPRFTREELDAMKAKAIADGTSVVATVEHASQEERVNGHSGAYTKSEIEAMKAKAQHTNLECVCGHHVTKANLAFVMRPKVQALIASEYKGKALCWHCQQSVLVGGVAFTPEQRKAGVHKSVAKANVNIK